MNLINLSAEKEALDEFTKKLDAFEKDFQRVEPFLRLGSHSEYRLLYELLMRFLEAWYLVYNQRLLEFAREYALRGRKSDE